jgi:hypothetical protein
MRRPAGRVAATRSRQPLGFGPNRVVVYCFGVAFHIYHHSPHFALANRPDRPHMTSRQGLHTPKIACGAPKPPVVLLGLLSAGSRFPASFIYVKYRRRTQSNLSSSVGRARLSDFGGRGFESGSGNSAHSAVTSRSCVVLPVRPGDSVNRSFQA